MQNFLLPRKSYCRIHEEEIGQPHSTSEDLSTKRLSPSADPFSMEFFEMRACDLITHQKDPDPNKRQGIGWLYLTISRTYDPHSRQKTFITPAQDVKIDVEQQNHRHSHPLEHRNGLPLKK
jgi:hypothetical protein